MVLLLQTMVSLLLMLVHRAETCATGRARRTWESETFIRKYYIECYQSTMIDDYDSSFVIARRNRYLPRPSRLGGFGAPARGSDELEWSRSAVFYY